MGSCHCSCVNTDEDHIRDSSYTKMVSTYAIGDIQSFKQ